MEQRITENMGRSLKEHGYLDPVFVGKGSFAKVYRVRDEKRDFEDDRSLCCYDTPVPTVL